MKQSFFIGLFLFLSLTTINAQTEYRDSITGYYSCYKTVNYYFVDTSYYTVSVTITKNQQGDSLVDFYEDGVFSRDFHLNADYTFFHDYGNNGGDPAFIGEYYLNTDSLIANHFATFGPAHQPVGTNWLCYKTAPLGLDETTFKPKISVVFTNGGLAIIQPNNQQYVDFVRLFSVDGKELLSEKTPSNNTLINCTFSPGIYLIALYKNNLFVDSKKLFLAID